MARTTGTGGRTTEPKGAALSWSDLKEIHVVPVAEERWCMNAVLRDRVRDAKNKLAGAKWLHDTAPTAATERDLKAKAKALEEAEAAVEAATITVRARAIGKRRQTLRRENQPNPIEVRENEELYAKFDRPVIPMMFSPSAYPPALIAACMVDPSFTEDEAVEMWESEEFSEQEKELLLNLCERANDGMVE